MGQRNPFPYIRDRYQGFIDHFSERNENKEPVVLEDGTSVLFPRGWTDEDADKWRKGNLLQHPGNYIASSYDLLGLFEGTNLLPNANSNRRRGTE